LSSVFVSREFSVKNPEIVESLFSSNSFQGGQIRICDNIEIFRFFIQGKRKENIRTGYSIFFHVFYSIYAIEIENSYFIEKNFFSKINNFEKKNSKEQKMANIPVEIITTSGTSISIPNSSLTSFMMRKIRTSANIVLQNGSTIHLEISESSMTVTIDSEISTLTNFNSSFTLDVNGIYFQIILTSNFEIYKVTDGLWECGVYTVEPELLS